MKALWLISCLALLWGAAMMSIYGSPLAFPAAWLSLVFWPPKTVDVHEGVDRPATTTRDGALLGFGFLLLLSLLDGVTLVRTAWVTIGIVARFVFLRVVTKAQQPSP